MEGVLAVVCSFEGLFILSMTRIANRAPLHSALEMFFFVLVRSPKTGHSSIDRRRLCDRSRLTVQLMLISAARNRLPDGRFLKSATAIPRVPDVDGWCARKCHPDSCPRCRNALMSHWRGRNIVCLARSTDTSQPSGEMLARPHVRPKQSEPLSD